MKFLLQFLLLLRLGKVNGVLFQEGVTHDLNRVHFLARLLGLLLLLNLLDLLEIAIEGSLVGQLIELVVHEDPDQEEERLDAQDDNEEEDPDLHEDVLSLKPLAFVEEPSGEAEGAEVEDHGNEGLQPPLIGSNVLTIVERHQLAEEGPESVDGQDDDDLHRWGEVSRSEHVQEVHLAEADDAGLHEEGAHVAEVEELRLQVHDEVLGLAVIPHVGVHVRHGLVTGDRLEPDQFTENEENNAGNDPVEEEHALEEEPGADVVHLVVPAAEVLLDDVDDVTEHVHGDSDENGL